MAACKKGQSKHVYMNTDEKCIHCLRFPLASFMIFIYKSIGIHKAIKGRAHVLLCLFANLCKCLDPRDLVMWPLASKRVATTTSRNAEHISQIRFGGQIALSAEWIYTKRMKGGSPHILNLRWTPTDDESWRANAKKVLLCPIKADL